MTQDAPVRQKLSALARALRHFHAALLEHAKSDYEFLHGKIDGPFTLFNLVVNDPEFQWLRPLSGLMATLDEVLDSKDELSERNVQDVRAALGALVGGTDSRFAEFQERYNRVKDAPEVRATRTTWQGALDALSA